MSFANGRGGCQRSGSRRNPHKEMLLFKMMIRSKKNKLKKLEIENISLKVIEDIIIDRLNAYVHWNEKWQEEWILGMMVTNYEDIDWEYLNKRANMERVNDSLKRMVDKAKKLLKLFEIILYTMTNFLKWIVYKLNFVFI